MKGLLLSILWILLVNMNINAQMQENQFKIYCFDWEYSKKFNLSTYDYDNSWYNFLNNADLDEAITIINDNDIEEYQWEKQLVKLNQSAYNFIQNMEFIPYMKFIVTLNEERVYAGEFISFISAMAIDHPVIIYDINIFKKSWENYIQIMPRNYSEDENIIENFIEKVGNKNIDRIKKYFEIINKLR